MSKKSGKQVHSDIPIDLVRSEGVIPVSNMNPVVVLKKIKPKALDNLPLICDKQDHEDSQQRPKEDTLLNRFQQELNLIHCMDVEEQNAHIRKCLEMSSENQITPKNAFTLQLIDCMSMILKEKKDFTVIASTLDASAKIYSSRVDHLHQRVVKLADEMVVNEMQKKDDEDESELLCKGKRRVRKENIIVSSESLKRKLKYKGTGSKYIKFEGVAGSITNRVRRNPKDLSYSLANDLPFWPDWENYTPLRIGGTIQLRIHLELIRNIIKTKANSKEKVESQEVELLSDSINSDVLASHMSDNDGFESKLDANIEPCSQTPETKELGVLSRVMNRMSQVTVSSRMEALKILFDKPSEYHYLNTKNAHLWAGPEFWRRPKVNKLQIEKETTFKKIRKIPSEIFYDLDSDVIENKWKLSGKGRQLLTNTTIQNWTRKKLTLPTDLKIEITLFFELFHLSNFDVAEDNLDISSEVQNTSKDSEINDKFIYNDAFEDLSRPSYNMDSLNTSFYEVIPGQSKDPNVPDCLNAGIIQQAREGSTTDTDADIVNTVQGSFNDQFNEANLVREPKIVTFKPVEFSIRPIIVDMRHLKDTMLEVIHEEIDSDLHERVAAATASCNNKDKRYNNITPNTRLSRITEVLRSRLDKRTAENLSIAMSFMALLTLTNENNFQLEHAEDCDVIITLERKPYEVGIKEYPILLTGENNLYNNQGFC